MTRNLIKLLSLCLSGPLLTVSIACSHYENKTPWEAKNESENNDQVRKLKENLKSQNLILDTKYSKLNNIIDKEHSFFALVTQNNEQTLTFKKISSSYNFQWNYNNIKNIFSNDKNNLFYKKNNNMVIEMLPIKNENKVLINLLFVRDIEGDFFPIRVYNLITQYGAEPIGYPSYFYYYPDKIEKLNNSSINTVKNENNQINISIKLKNNNISPVTETNQIYTKFKDNIKLPSYKSYLFYSKNYVPDKTLVPNKIIKIQQREFDDIWYAIYYNHFEGRIWTRNNVEFVSNYDKYAKLTSNTQTSVLKLLAKSYIINLKNTKLSYDKDGKPNNIKITLS
ncbi:hypothetical protein [Mycoplasma sp. 4423]